MSKRALPRFVARRLRQSNNSVWACELRDVRIPKAARNKDRRDSMPLVNVKLIEGVFTPAQKQDMIRKLTDTMVAIEGENLRQATLVVLEEVKSGDWGVGGHGFTTD